MGIKPPILSENVSEMAVRALLAAKKWGTLIGPGMKSLNIVPLVTLNSQIPYFSS